jgi:hypothetical protein
VVIARDIKPVVDNGASTAPDHDEAFPNDVSKLSTAATIGHRLAIHGNLEVASTVSAASPYTSVISKVCFPRQCTQAWTLASLFPQESYHSITRSQRSLRNGAIIGAEASHGLVSDQSYSAALGAKSARGLARDQSNSAFPDSLSPARFRRKGIIVDYDYNAVLEKAPPSVLKLPLDRPANKVPALSWTIYRPPYPVSLPLQETGWLLDSSQIVATVQPFRSCAFSM